jgi:hypothetical protein
MPSQKRKITEYECSCGHSQHENENDCKDELASKRHLEIVKW